MHCFTRQTMLNQTLYYTIRYFAVIYLFIQHEQPFLLSSLTQKFVIIIRTSAGIKKFIVSSSNNIIILYSNIPFYSVNNAESIAVLGLHYNIYLEPNNKSKGVVSNHPAFVADVAKSSLVAVFTFFACSYFDHDASMHYALHVGL